MPSGWEVVCLGDCLQDYRNGWPYNARAAGGSLPITRIETIAGGEIDYSRVGQTEYEKGIESYQLRAGDILFSFINSVEHIGKVAIKRDDALLYHGLNLMRFRVNERILADFLYMVLRSQPAREHFRSYARGSASQASLTKGDIASYRFWMPPTDEQTRIVDVLSAIDDVAKCNNSITSKEGMTRGAVGRLWDGVCSDLLFGRVRVPL